MNKQTFLANGGLDFTVSKVKMHTYNTLHADDYTETPFFATVNDQTGQALGPVRSAYTVKQNYELLEVADLSSYITEMFDLVIEENKSN